MVKSKGGLKAAKGISSGGLRKASSVSSSTQKQALEAQMKAEAGAYIAKRLTVEGKELKGWYITTNPRGSRKGKQIHYAKAKRTDKTEVGKTETTLTLYYDKEMEDYYVQTVVKSPRDSSTSRVSAQTVEKVVDIFIHQAKAKKAAKGAS